ncbi:MAG: uracil-DNA glycosylase family protein, partial [Acidimicrobiales bacterium]
VDLGCGPGWHVAALGDRAVALDASRSMLDLVGRRAPTAPRIVASVSALPFRSSGLAGALASRVYVHLPQIAVPAALADLHRSLRVDSPVELVVFGGDAREADFGAVPDDDYPGRRYSAWSGDRLADVIDGAGFAVDRCEVVPGAGLRRIEVSLRRLRTLPDTVGPGMRLLVCGLNPSGYSADIGVGFGRPGNRFWPAALAAGLVTVDRDPRHALRAHGIGMTDLVKRATTRASDLGAEEYSAGIDRLGRLCDWLVPRAVCVVGLAGWRAAVDRRAAPGWQGRRLGGRPVYVMPSTSGLNAHSRLSDLTEHLGAAAAGRD